MNPTTASPLLLDIGCGWGRWCIAAARTGFVPVGIEPSLKLLMAAERVAKQLGVRARFVVADSRFLPFRTGIFDAAFSFGVLQHFSKPNVVKTLHALTSVMKVGATTKLHLVNARGLRGLYIQMRRGWSDVGDFDVRYWTVPEALKTFSLILGPSSIEVDGFFVQARREDRHMLLPHNRLILDISRGVTELSRLMPPLKHVADNFYVVSNVTGATA